MLFLTCLLSYRSKACSAHSRLSRILQHDLAYNYHQVDLFQ